MKIIKDILNRNKIEKDILKLIESQFSKLTVSKLTTLNDRKAQKKLDQTLVRLRGSLKSYISEQELGVYGLSKALNVVQNKLVSMGFEMEMAKGVVENVMLH